jgi:hypothetical protein
MSPKDVSSITLICSMQQTNSNENDWKARMFDFALTKNFVFELEKEPSSKSIVIVIEDYEI